MTDTNELNILAARWAALHGFSDDEDVAAFQEGFRARVANTPEATDHQRPEAYQTGYDVACTI